MRKILLVEDDALLNRTLTYNLTEEGYQVTPASRYREAVQHIQATEFDLALLDVNLPDSGSLDLCQEIRGRGQRTYLMFLTANDREADILQGYEAGGGDYVTKPFSLPVLCRKIAAVFDHLDLHAPAATDLTTGCWPWTSPPRPPPWPGHPWTSPPRSSACWPSL